MTQKTFRKILEIAFMAILLMISRPAMFGQVNSSRSVAGYVLDKDDNPIIGAGVLIKGTKTGAVTDSKGWFSLKGVTSTTVLEVSSLGYSPKTITVGSNSELRIKLADDATVLEDVVVVGYTTQRRASITGAIANVRSQDLIQTKSANVANTLVGKLPGLRAVQRSGAPGEDIPEMDIRGFGNALVIVDGVERGFAKLDPNDVESISILKDASAAVYGSKGANGVILVTTKRGVKGKPVFEYSSWTGIQQMTRYPKVYNSLQYALLTNEAANNINLPDVYSSEQIEKFKTGDGEFYKSTNWLTAVTRKTAPATSHNFSAKGGTDIANYYVSFGVADQQSYFKSNDWKDRRYNIHANIGTKLAEGLTAQLLITGLSEKRDISGGSAVFQNIQTAKPFGSAYYYGEPVGPLRATYKKYGYSIDDEKTLDTSFDIKWELPWVDGLSLNAKMSYDVFTYRYKTWSPQDPYTYEPTESGDVVKSYVGSTVGRLNDRFGNNYTKDFQMNLSYSKIIDKHDISAMAIYQATNPSSEWLSGYREFSINSLPIMNAGNDLNKKNDGNESSSLVKAWIGRVNYAYDGKYLLEAIGRYDGSSTFAPKCRWGFFPSLSLGWRISQENFFKDIFTKVSNLKLRASYGIVGDQSGFSAFQWQEGYYYPGGKYLFDEGNPTIGLVSSGLANEDLTWFKSKIANVGFDLGMFNNKLSFEADVFQRNRSGLMAYRTLSLPTSFGESLPQENLNSDMTRGFELVAGNTGNIGDLTYNVKGNFTFTKSRNKHIERSADENKYYNWRNNSNDRNKNLTWGYVMIGQFQSYEDILNSPIQDSNGNKTLLPGDFKYKDLNDDGIIDDKDVKVIGQGNTPLAYYSLNINMAYHGFDMNIFFQGAGGHKLQLGSAFYQPFIDEGNCSGMTIWYNERSHRVDPSDPNSEWIIGKLPPVRKAGFSNNQKVNTYYLLNADYLRLKTLEIGYSLPQRICNIVKLQKFRVYVNSNNLLTFTKGWLMKNIDPENSNSNAWYYPQAKTYNVGVDLSF